jgi:xylulose-5-phosphate/fructose-6-phosphate phosphoketolase
MTAPPASRAVASRAEHPLHLVDAWWRAANYLTVGQIYLKENALLTRPLQASDIKTRLLGHWGTSPALNFIYAHLNRLIVHRALEVLYIAGPGHGGPAMVANAWLDHTYSELYPHITQDAAGMRSLFRQFSAPGGIPSHASPDTPGSIHEGGELGYSLVHAFGAALDNPQLIVACVVGDGEAETGTLAASWHLNKFLNPNTDGVVLPILNLNGYKIANPSVLARIPEPELLELFRGYGYHPILVSGGFDGENPMAVHARMAAAMDEAADEIAQIRKTARSPRKSDRPSWPMIILRTPKGWTGPRVVDGLPVEGTWRSHQVPLANVAENPEHLAQLESWLRSYEAEELFDTHGAPNADIAMIRPRGEHRMSAQPASNGGSILQDLILPPIEPHAVDIGEGRGATAEATRVLGHWLAEVIRANPNFRIFGPDETASNRLDAVYEVTAKQWEGITEPTDVDLATEGKVIEILSENLVEGLLEGYLLTGRHGLMNSYEAFIHVVDSMFNQHAKWLESAGHIAWRRPVASLTYLLSSHVWRQDHNGFSHQDPGFLNHVVNKSAAVVRVYLPPDANSLLATAEHCLASRDYINVIVAGKQPAPTFLTIAEARTHGARGVGIWQWAGTESEGEPADVVVACAGDVPTMEAIAAVQMLHHHIPTLRIRFVNVVDLMRLQSSDQHPHGLSTADFDAIFTTDRPVIFAFHGYPALIHQLAYKHTNHPNFHVRGFKEKGTTTTPFDMLMLNDLDRYRIAMDVIRYVPGLEQRFGALVAHFGDERARMRAYAYEHGEDSPEVTGTPMPTAQGADDTGAPIGG